MTTDQFVALLRSEFVLQGDPHLIDRFKALLEEHYEPKVPAEPSDPPLESAAVAENPSSPESSDSAPSSDSTSSPEATSEPTSQAPTGQNEVN